MRSDARAWAAVAGAVVVVAVAVTLAAGRDGGVVTSDERTQRIAAELRCPVCQNLSVADSPSALAREMRAEIRQRLAAGASDADVRAYFVERYGEWVLLEPPRRGLNLVPWLLPLAGITLGAALWFGLVRRAPRRTPVPVSEEERRRIDRELGSLEDAPS